MARAEDGEALGVLTGNPRLRTSIQLDLRLVAVRELGLVNSSALTPSILGQPQRVVGALEALSFILRRAIGAHKFWRLAPHGQRVEAVREFD